MVFQPHITINDPFEFLRSSIGPTSVRASLDLRLVHDFVPLTCVNLSPWFRLDHMAIPRCVTPTSINRYVAMSHHMVLISMTLRKR